MTTDNEMPSGPMQRHNEQTYYTMMAGMYDARCLWLFGLVSSSLEIDT
jgi:hypothetical protein